MRVMKETVTLPTVWQEAFVFPNTQAKQSNSVDEQEEEPAVDLMLVVLNCCRNRVNWSTQIGCTKCTTPTYQGNCVPQQLSIQGIQDHKSRKKGSLLRRCTQFMTSTYTALYLSYLGMALFFLYKNVALHIVIYISVNESSLLRFIRTKYNNKYPTYLLLRHVFLWSLFVVLLLRYLRALQRKFTE